MKRRYLAVLMGVMVATTSVPAMVYAEDVKTERAADEASDESSEKADGSDENAQSDEAEENVVLGEVKSVSDTEITIAVGTMKEMRQPGGNGQGQTITITENTVITKQSGGMQQGQTGGDGQNGGVPEKPDGDGQGAEAEEISLSDIQEGDIVSITLDEDGNAASITVMSMEMSGQSQGVDSYTAVNEYTEDTTVSGETLESTGTDENAALISSGASVTLDNDTITRTSDSSTGGDNSSFYGVGAAVLATDGTAYVKDGSVTTDAAGGAGLFAYGDGTVYASGTTVKTTQDTSGGVHVAGGGTLYGWNLDVETNGESSAAIRSDRGGGTMVIDGGNYVSNGVGSPAIYSTADIAVSNASLTANGSEAVCIEGLNSIHLYDCDLTGNMSDLDQNDNTWTVILYQSMSGDSEVGNSTFQMDGGSLTSENGGVFYTTNTESTITLSNVDINYNDDNEFFLQCTGNTNQRGWGQSGANGADCHFTGISQDMQGNVIWDSISDLDFYLTEGSSLTGAVVDDETYAGEGGDGYCNVYVSSDSTWTVTGDSTVSSLENEGTIVDSEGKTVTIQGTDGTVYVQGDSEYTITTGSYSDSVDLSGATSIQDQSAYTVEKPDQL
ncbi:hypothetical protein [Ruminococcus sp. AF31-8BH]|uniref:hypothetical protein n=1 Tax=Ruminococcus sp. AF31-8BH TaxID=2293174 RepID=UPI000E53C688|nr:hypothetical protein [Ruminococcus sp. AF31-8BH]RGF75517.1 hypothetical protein DWZ38_06300 [Ruminococcus sp. AF31-8BH]